MNTRDSINNFIKQNQNKKVIVVQGLGFVGAVMSLVCANSISEEYVVIGVDLPSNIDVINKLNKGVFPIKSSDLKVQDYFNNAIQKKNFLATYDEYAYSLADIIIVDINLDVEKTSSKNKELIDFDVDLSNFKNAIRTIGKNCKENTLILVETTVPPGTCEKIVKPLINQEISKEN